MLFHVYCQSGACYNIVEIRTLYEHNTHTNFYKHDEPISS